MQLFNLEDDIGVVTGALGKLGPIWVETLLAAGARVLALDRPGTPEAPAFQELQAASGLNGWRWPSLMSAGGPSSKPHSIDAGGSSATHRPSSSTTPGSTPRRRPAARDTGWKTFRSP